VDLGAYDSEEWEDEEQVCGGRAEDSDTEGSEGAPWAEVCLIICMCVCLHMNELV
jgi:hypothetical protein